MLHLRNFRKRQKPLVLLHGFMEDHTIWSDMESHFSKEFTLIKIDLSGHGKSENNNAVNSMDFMAEKSKRSHRKA